VLRAIEEETGSSLFDLLCRCHPEA
jgi:hypothetical protein